MTDETPPGLTGPALARHIGVTYRQLDYWVRQGWLKPAHIVGRPSTGTGHSRVFMGQEIVKAEHMGRMVAWGVRPSVAATVALELAENDGVGHFGPYVITFAFSGAYRSAGATSTQTGPETGRVDQTSTERNDQ